MTNRQWITAILGTCVVLGALMQGPFLLRALDDRYKGVYVPLNSDEEVYMARVQEALSGRPEQSAEAFIGHPGLIGSQFAFIEMLEGSFFRPLGLRAGDVLTIMDSIEPILVFLLVLFFLRFCGFRRRPAFAAAVLFCLIELYNLNRPIHLRASFILMMLAFCGLAYALRAAKKHQRRAVVGMMIGGVVLGLLVGVYFWSWTFAWLWWGIFLGWELLEWAGIQFAVQAFVPSRLRRVIHTVGHMFWHLRPRKPNLQLESWHVLLFSGAIGAFVASPFVLQLLEISYHPLFEQAVFRSGMHPSRLPESWPYSILFAVMVVSLLWTSVRDPQALRPYRPAVVTVFTAFVFMNQQVIHGTVFNFVSHAIFSLMLAAFCAVLLAVARPRVATIVAAGAACVYLAAITYDGRYILSQWKVHEDDFVEQHLAETLPYLDALPRSRILSDLSTSAFIAGYTKHDVVSSAYLKNVLITHEELAVRRCLTLLPISPLERHIADQHHLIYPDASEAYGSDVRREEVRLVEEQCALVDAEPAAAIRAHEIDFVLWNEKAQPNWNLARLELPLTEVAKGDGWHLFTID